jgi:hypothetical protein
MRTVTFNGTALTGSTIRIQETEWESIDNREVQIERLGNKDGGKLVGDMFAPRVIRVRGLFLGTSIDDLENNIETYKALFTQKEKNIDFEYNSGTRRFKVTLTGLRITKGVGNVTMAPFEATFVASNSPFATLLDTSTVGFTGVGTNFGTFYGNFVAAGTAKPMPIIKATINGGSGITFITFTNTTTGGSITVTPAAGFTAGDVLLINTEDYTVTINGVAVDYSGFFPDFAQGGNNFKRVVGSVWHSINLKLIYRPYFL